MRQAQPPITPGASGSPPWSQMQLSVIVLACASGLTGRTAVSAGAKLGQLQASSRRSAAIGSGAVVDMPAERGSRGSWREAMPRFDREIERFGKGASMSQSHRKLESLVDVTSRQGV